MTLWWEENKVRKISLPHCGRDVVYLMRANGAGEKTDPGQIRRLRSWFPCMGLQLYNSALRSPTMPGVPA